MSYCAYLGEHVNSLLVKIIITRKPHRTTRIKVIYLLVYNRSINSPNFYPIESLFMKQKPIVPKNRTAHLWKNKNSCNCWSDSLICISIYLLINCNSDELEIYNVVKMYAIFFSLENLCTLNCNFRYIFFLSGNKHTCNIQTASCFSKTF